jgi:hypothetical protein
VEGRREVNKVIVTAAILMLGTVTFAADQSTANQPPAQQLQADPLVSALNQLVDSLSNAGDAEAPAAANANPADGNSAAAKSARSKKDSAVAIGTAAAIGSALGALIAKDDRAKGAAIGAAVGGIAGLVYDRMRAKTSDTAADPNPQPQPTTTVPELNKKIL